MKIQKEWAEMVADKIRGYHIHGATGLVCVSFRGDWVMHENGYLVRSSISTWDIPGAGISNRAEVLESLITDIAQFSGDDSFIGINKGKISLVRWHEDEASARTSISYTGGKKIWDCKEKRYI